MDVNIRPLKEPRGFIRIIQLVFAIFAFSTTASFESASFLNIYCPKSNPKSVEPKTPEAKISKYEIEYPFELEKSEFTYVSNCSTETNITKKFPMDFSSSARFYVTTGVLCMLYCIGALIFYVFSAPYYATNPLIPVLDLIATAIFTVFWFAGSCAWAAGVSDLKFYTNPNYLKKHLNICKESGDVCTTNKVANWSGLNISLIFGFANVFLWAASMWFVFKETHFHQKPIPAPAMHQVSQQQSFGAYNDPIGTQPKSQTGYPNVQQQSQQQQYMPSY